jgi:neutral peptidase B
MLGLESLSFHFSDGVLPRVLKRMRSGGIGPPREVLFNSDEAAARYYLDQLLRGDARPAMRGVLAVESPQLVPNLRMEKAQEIRWPAASMSSIAGNAAPPLKTKKTTIVRFSQVHHDIPVFGSSAVVELDDKRCLVSARVGAAAPGPAAPISKVSNAEAIQAISEFTGTPVESLAGINGTLIYFHDDSAGTWRHAWFFRKVPAAPISFIKSGPSTLGLPGPSPRMIHMRFDYVIDATNRKVLLSYTSTPTLAVMTPIACQGFDDEGNLCSFVGRRVADPACVEMHDEMRHIKTFDNDMQPYDSGPAPAYPVRNSTGDFGNQNAAAISAHKNAQQVMLFYRGVLARSGIDDQNMELVSRVKCVASDGKAPIWKQAQWYDNVMWYGQWQDAQGQVRSLAAYLDVMAHELTHGVVEHSAGLKYFGESGALDESFADIFAIVIKHSSARGGTAPADEWKWVIGEGLGADGGPLRDLSRPAVDNTSKIVPTFDDNGGVHALSGIHTKAAQSVFTARAGDGSLLFSWEHVAFLYYLCLCRLAPLATFSDARQILVDAAKTFFSGLPDDQRCLRITAIEMAYDEVGIA